MISKFLDTKLEFFPLHRKIGILPATFRAMRLALDSFEVEFDKIYVDGSNRIPNIDHWSQETLVKGDSLLQYCSSFDCSKSSSRQIYARTGKGLPEFGFEKRVGYGTKAHLQALRNMG